MDDVAGGLTGRRSDGAFVTVLSPGVTCPHVKCIKGPRSPPVRVLPRGLQL